MVTVAPNFDSQAQQTARSTDQLSLMVPTQPSIHMQESFGGRDVLLQMASIARANATFTQARSYALP
jgi:hypothetical protein